MGVDDWPRWLFPPDTGPLYVYFQSFRLIWLSPAYFGLVWLNSIRSTFLHVCCRAFQPIIDI